MTEDAGEQVRASRLVPVLAVLLAGGVAALAWPATSSLLGLFVVAAALVLRPRETTIAGGTAVGLALVAALAGSGDLRWARVANVVVASALALCVSLLLDRRRRDGVTSRLREDEILAAMPEAVIVLDASGVLLRANAGLARIAPEAKVGARLHPALGHVLSDGEVCSGGCSLDGVRPAVQDHSPVEGERLTRDGRALPIAYTIGHYGADQLVATIRDVSTRIAAQQDREVLLASAARSEEQANLVRALGGPRVRISAATDVAVDSWLPDGSRGTSSSGLASLTRLPDGRCLLLMASGEADRDAPGYEPTRDAWKVLYVARAHLTAGAPLAEMISRAADSLADESDVPAATVVGAILDPVTGLVQVASGGHPPPLLVRSDGSSSWLEAAGRPIGDELPRSVSLARAEMSPGDSLLVYGLGIVDGTRDVVEGMSALRSAAVALRAEPTSGVAERIGRATVPPGITREQADILMVLRMA